MVRTGYLHIVVGALGGNVCNGVAAIFSIDRWLVELLNRLEGGWKVLATTVNKAKRSGADEAWEKMKATKLVIAT